LYNKDTKKPVTNTCLLGLVNQTDTSCKYTKTLLTTQINYVEPNIIVKKYQNYTPKSHT